ncbi:AAA family ATPase [candidate division KSB1 bacterium]|nr:AAA family ATPase [candidate division KSB1 bacterium]
MKIEKISRISRHRCFRRFSWPSDLNGFSRYNLLYGWNGSGKTTITNLFRVLETQQSVSEGEVSIIVDGRTVDLHNISSSTLPQVRVFNEDFVTENVFTNHGSVTPIFYLGEKNIEIQTKINDLKELQEKARDELSKKQELESDKKAELDDFCKDRANNTIKPLLSSSGSNPYNNYNKTSFRGKCEEFLNVPNLSSYLLDDSSKDDFKRQKEGTPKEKIRIVSNAFIDFDSLQSDVKDILRRTVVSQVLEELRTDQDLADWVKLGIVKHETRNTQNCLFCGQRLPEGRIPELEAHFNDHYNKYMLTIEDKIRSLQNQMTNCDSISIPEKAQFYDHLINSFKDAVVHLKQQVSLEKRALQLLKEQLEGKKSKPFQSVTLNLSPPVIEESKLNDVNQLIVKHNQKTDDFEKDVKEARKRLEESTVAESLPEYLKKKNAIEKAEIASSQTKIDMDELTQQIEILEREIIEHRKPAEELNQDLQNYLGRSDLRFEVMETGYQIYRKDQIANALSKGEKDAIAFLYFLKSLSDKSFDLRKGIVVIDDPASSLDSNALFYAFSFMKERTKEAGQLFVFTHNFAFFRQVKNWFHNLKGQKKKDLSKRPASFYMVKCDDDSGERYSRIDALDPLLERYDSEYHYLFSLIFRVSKGESGSDLQRYYHLPNIARRVLEAFLSFKRPRDAGELQKQLDSIDFDPEKKTRILRFLHTHSHKGHLDEPEHDLSILSETPKVLADVLELIKSEDQKHYEEITSLLVEETPN